MISSQHQQSFVRSTQCLLGSNTNIQSQNIYCEEIINPTEVILTIGQSILFQVKVCSFNSKTISLSGGLIKCVETMSINDDTKISLTNQTKLSVNQLLLSGTKMSMTNVES